jgi:phosphate transport system permease protein
MARQLTGNWAGRDPSLIDLTGKRNRILSERLIGLALLACAALSIVTTVGIVLILLIEALRFFREVPLWDFLTGTEWTALFKDKQFGVLPLVAGTLWITAIAMVVALPIGLMCAIYLSEYASERTRSILKPVLELLAGIPTIVYGYFALTFLTPELLKRIIPGIPVLNALSAGIAVGILVLPLVASLSEDALRAVPTSLREAAYGLGATKREVAMQVVVPAAFSGVVASFILATSRAVGETMVVAIASGGRPNLTWDPREGMQTMTAYIVAVFSGDVVYGSIEYLSLFAVGLLLFLITLAMNFVSQWISARFREEYQ